MGRRGRVICKRDRGAQKRRRGASDDEDYVFGEEEEEESSDEALASDATEEEFELCESSCGSEEEREIDYDDDDDDDDEDDQGGADDEAAAVAEEEVVEVLRSMPWTGRARRSRVSVEDEAVEGNDEDWVRSRRRNSVVLDYAEEEEDDDDRDEDFLPDDGDDNDIDEDEISLVSRKKGDIKRGAKKRKSRVLKHMRLEKRMRKTTSDEDDEDFAVELSDSDFPNSEDDLVLKKPISSHKQRNTIKNVERRKRWSVESESSSDSDYKVFEGELKDLVDGGVVDQLHARKTITKGEEKGKEKEGDDLGMHFCGICLSEEQKRTVQGELDCCQHFFCFSCIIEWSKVETRCPVCKRRFSTITKTSKSDTEFGMRKVVRVQIRDQVYHPSEEEIMQMLDPYGNVVCIECQQDGDESLMLLCDICDSCAHTYCVGLGREVPEGNWYCDCCRFTTNGSSNLQNQGTVTDEGAHSSEAYGIETEVVALHTRANTNSQQSVSLPCLVASRRIDLNAPPILEDDHEAMSQVGGGGASTLSGRRAIHQRICILFSNSRPRQMFNQNDVLNDKVEIDVMSQEVEQIGQNLHSSKSLHTA